MRFQGVFICAVLIVSLCTPLGACLVYRGVEGCIPFLHGSQGCATYIRRCESIARPWVSPQSRLAGGVSQSWITS